MRKFILFFSLFVFVSLPLLTLAAYTAQPIEFDPGYNVQRNTRLGNRDPVEVVSNIINWGLTILGLVALVIIIYGGLTWMLAGGNEEKVTKAKNILKAGIIGLLIILASYGIASYVFTNIYNMTNR